jgi:hypothetical protein
VEWFEKMKSNNLKPNEFSYSTLISKAPDYKTSVEWFEKMKSNNLKPNEFSYSTLISKAPDYKTSVEWFEKMKSENLKPNCYCYTALIGKSTENVALLLLNEMKESSVSPNAVTFGTWMHYAGKNVNKQKVLIDAFLSVFEVGKDFGAQELKGLQMHPMSILIFAEEIYKIAPNQKEIICVLLEKVKQSLVKRYIKAVADKFKIISPIVNCFKK